MWTGRYHESVEQYLIALKIDPSFLSSVIGASDALSVTGQFHTARKLLAIHEELFARRNQQDTREIKLLQVAYQAEEWAEVVTNVERLRVEKGFASYEPGLRLWANTLGAIAMAELGRTEDADALVASTAEKCRSVKTCSCCERRSSAAWRSSRGVPPRTSWRRYAESSRHPRISPTAFCPTRES
jgi:hypothetical protein